MYYYNCIGCGQSKESSFDKNVPICPNCLKELKDV